MSIHAKKKLYTNQVRLIRMYVHTKKNQYISSFVLLVGISIHFKMKI